ncbi:hypothetical protein DITRI_Ditri12bG0117300 [Diplodiscus trichospermus]
MEGSFQECDQVEHDSHHPFENLDESSHPLEQPSLQPEGDDGSFLNRDETRFLTMGFNNSNSQDDEDGEDNIDGSDDSLEGTTVVDDDDYIDDIGYYSDDYNFDNQPRLNAGFERVYSCFPLSVVNKTGLEIGNKIIMPAEALMPLIKNQISMPMQFEVQNQATGRVSHCGVSEFTGEGENVVFLPDWMMKNMGSQEGDLMLMKDKTLETGTYIKLQPHTTDFLGISNLKAVLEENLQKYSCLTMGDTIMISHEGKNFYINIIETKPSAAISIIDADCNVDFAPPPLDYKEPEEANKSASGKEQDDATQKPKFKPFTGLARRLDENFCSNMELDSASLPNEQQSAVAVFQTLAAEAKATSKRSSQGLVFETDRRQSENKGKELITSEMEAETNLKNKPKLQPFTGKKYTLAG